MKVVETHNQLFEMRFWCFLWKIPRVLMHRKGINLTPAKWARGNLKLSNESKMCLARYVDDLSNECFPLSLFNFH